MYKKRYGGVKMSNIHWNTVDVRQLSRRSGDLFVSIGQGRIALSAAACRLIENIYDYKYVEAQCGKENGRVTKIGLKFCKNKTQNSLSVARRKYKGELVEGVNINSKSLIAEFFGTTKDKVSSRYTVEKIDDDMLAIDITCEI